MPEGAEPERAGGEPVETRRVTNRRSRRRQIVGAARRLIFSDGLPALSMRRLADEAGVSVMTLYNLFGSKDEILEAVIDEAVATIDATLDAEAPADTDPFGRCCAVITVSIDHFASEPGVFQPMLLSRIDRMLHPERSAGDHGLRRGRGVRMQEEGLAEAHRQGLLRPHVDIGALASQIYHGYELAAMQWANGQLDTEGFRARALYGLWLALVATCADEQRPALELELQAAAADLQAAITTERSSHRNHVNQGETDAA